VCFRLRARSRSTSPASGEQITHWVDHSGSDPNPLRVCFGLVLLLCDDIRHKQVLLAVGPFSRYPEAQVAQYLASSPAVGRRFMAIQGDLAHVAWQLSHDFPSLLCDLLVFIPDHIMPGAESEAEEETFQKCLKHSVKGRGEQSSPCWLMTGDDSRRRA
jgi:hypothetical protein